VHGPQTATECIQVTATPRPNRTAEGIRKERARSRCARRSGTTRRFKAQGVASVRVVRVARPHTSQKRPAEHRGTLRRAESAGRADVTHPTAGSSGTPYDENFILLKSDVRDFVRGRSLCGSVGN
jgi:hypothetical protein